VVVIAILLWTSVVSAQTASFTYQGRLTDGGTAANGNYDLQFALFDSLSGGAQVGSTLTLNTVAVSNGVFTVSLDFGANAFNGAGRFLEISARPSGGGSFTLLSPRQQVTSTPYAVRSLNAASADSVPASGVPSGSGNYIQNSSSTQASSNFNISGVGTANIVNATTQFNLNGKRILSNSGGFNLFAGETAGASNTDGNFNTFAGAGAGAANTNGSVNAFFGQGAGFKNTTGSFNSFFGEGAGSRITGGESNAFFGAAAGSAVVDGSNNTFVGGGAGSFNSTSNGDNNTLLGANTFVSSTGLFNPTNATAIGAKARVDASNSLVLGSINGTNLATADTNVGIGTTTPATRLHIKGAAETIRLEGTSSGNANRAYVAFYDALGPSGFVGDEAAINNATYLGSYVGDVVLFPSIGETLRATSTGRVGIGDANPADKLDVDGDIRTGTSGTNGCLKNNNGGTLIGTCSSDLRFKRNLTPFGSVLNQVTRLQPKYFYWRASEFKDKGFGPEREAGLIAQEVEQVLPQLVSEDSEGYKLVDYSKLPLMLLQAVKELKAENDQLKQRLHKVERTLRTRSSVARR
jgi:hypothetical protein